MTKQKLTSIIVMYNFSPPASAFFLNDEMMKTSILLRFARPQNEDQNYRLLTSQYRNCWKYNMSPDLSDYERFQV